jgi:hypothetical protein
MLKTFTIFETATNAHIETIVLDDDKFIDPSDNCSFVDPLDEDGGTVTEYAYPAWDAGTMSFVEITGTADEHYSNFDGTDWVPSLAKARARKCQEAKAFFTARRSQNLVVSGVTVDDIEVACDVESRMDIKTNYDIALNAIANGLTLDITFPDAVFNNITLDQDQIVSVGTAVMNDQASLMINYNSVCASIMDPGLTDVADIDALDVTSGY